MTDLRTAALLRQALEALEQDNPAGRGATIRALRAALEQPEPPPEAQTKAEQIAYCAGWWAAMEAKARSQPEPVCVGCEGKPTPQNSPCAVCSKIAQQEPVEIKPPNPEGATQCIVRWMAETPAGWIGAWDQEALAQFARHAEPDPPPEPLHEDKIRAEFREMDRCCLPGEMTVEDWFEAGVRYAERQHEIV